MTTMTMTWDSNGRASVVIHDEQRREIWSGGSNTAGVSDMARVVRDIVSADVTRLGNGSRGGVAVPYNDPVYHRIGPVEIDEPTAERVIQAVGASIAREQAWPRLDSLWRYQRRNPLYGAVNDRLEAYAASEQYRTDCLLVGQEPERRP